MLEIANQLVQSLFKKNSLQECSRWELEILADKYPYFGIAQLLVSGKLKQENAAEYEKQLQKTSLYFSNPLWLDYILNKKSPLPEETNGDAHAQSVTTAPERIADNTDDAPVLPEPVVTNIETAVIEARHDKPVADEIAEAPPADDTSIPAEEPVTGNIETPVNDANEEIPLAGETTEPQETIDSPAETSIGEPLTINNESTRETKEDIPVLHDDENKQEEIRIAPLNQEPMPGADAPLTFEPYYTVDYFASQGIKLSQEEKPKDRFGQQLKSFTQWLKTIKNIPPAEIAKETGKGGDQKVITLAEHSLDDREIVTEAMAEVWVKQGKREKAIDVYNKLSLQNPAKSAYFASLIEQLKQH